VGGGPAPGGGSIVADKGVGGAEPFSDSAGTRFDRTRMIGLGGPPLASIGLTVAGRAGGGGGGVPVATAPKDLPGDAVCALGGGGGCEGFAASEPAVLFTHRFKSLS